MKKQRKNQIEIEIEWENKRNHDMSNKQIGRPTEPGDLKKYIYVYICTNTYSREIADGEKLHKFYRSAISSVWSKSLGTK
ncbi:hypothetical protein M5D96_013328 [Drosophila gunungcola]|uniref:Uncharacterized protein n=1 Tax=Drosophila gunungcola TaxID=103775 RepID=A0A9P9YBJ7_9MUSC|nr:hypothetical protein M5D96_013328 [Drosophila gunungcola]